MNPARASASTFVRTYERARLSRDPRFDGRFFVGVHTTGIYCRPVCPANAPRPENVSYFPSAAAAAEAGFRPCLRCRPECAPGTPAWNGTSTTVRRGLRLIADGALDDGDVEHLAERLGVTSRHLRRLFAEHVGASPLAVAQTQRLQFAKRLIDDSRLPMADIAIAAGYGSVRRFNDAFRRTYGRPPRELRRSRDAATVNGSALQVRISARSPFDPGYLLDFFAARATPGVEDVNGNCYRRSVEIDGVAGTLEATLDVDGIDLALHGIPTSGLLTAVRRARDLFDLDAPTADIADLLGGDELLCAPLARNPGVRVPGAWDGFELTVRAILGQQVSVAAATTLAGRLVARYGEPLTPSAGDCRYLFPAPGRLTRARLDTLGLVRSRAQTIRDLARAVVAGDVHFSAGQGFDDFRRRLQAIRGIGDWTAQYVAMRVARDPDAFPAADLGLLRAFDTRAGRRLGAKELEVIADDWRPWRAYAAMLLWHADPGSGG